jgi:UDPglucose 6-dehydrogenase
LKQKKKISFIGVTHLSIVYGYAAASKGYKVMFYDTKNSIFFKNEKNLVDEPNLDKLYRENKDYIFFSKSIKDIFDSEIIFIAPDIETDSEGKSNYKKINMLINLTLKKIKKDQILVILSQVSPGFTRKLLKKHNLVYYMVETLIFGNAVERALNPERLIIGKSDSNKNIERKFSYFLKQFSKNIIEMNFESAEICKIAINIYLASSVTTTNFLNNVASKMNANWDSIKLALNMDKRIGKFAYLEPGLGISGGNIERDLKSITEISRNLGVNKNFIDVIKKNSVFYKDWAYRTIKNSTKKVNLNYGILGLAYKENTNSIKNSPSIRLIKKLQSKENKLNRKIYVYDPKVNSIDNLNIIFMNSYIDVIKNSDILVIMTKWIEFKKITKKDIDKFFKGSVLIDTYEHLDKKIRNSKKYSFYSIKNSYDKN